MFEPAEWNHLSLSCFPVVTWVLIASQGLFMYTYISYASSLLINILIVSILILFLVPWFATLFAFIKETQARVIWEEGTSVENMPPSDWPRQIYKACSWLITDGEGSAYDRWYHLNLWAVGITSRLVVQVCVKKQAEQVLKNQLVSIIHAQSLF